MAEIERLVAKYEKAREATGTGPTSDQEHLIYVWRLLKREEKLRQVQRTFLDDVALTLYAAKDGRGPRECYELAKQFLAARSEFVK